MNPRMALAPGSRIGVTAAVAALVLLCRAGETAVLPVDTRSPGWDAGPGTRLAGQQQSAPFLRLVPSVTFPGRQVTAFASGFYRAPTCSPVTVEIYSSRAAHRRVVQAGIQVAPNGTFQIPFSVSEAPGLYTVSATQTRPDGTVVADFQPLIVGLADEAALPARQFGDAHRSSLAGKTPAAGWPDASRQAAALDTGGSALADQPAIEWGGRAVAVDASPTSTSLALVASESGGLFKTTDMGRTWTHVDALMPFRLSDVKFSPDDPSVVLTTAWLDGRRSSSGGIWRSMDGGATWTKPPTADPLPGPACPERYIAWGIAFVPGTSLVYVGTDCGVAISEDRGATWRHVVPAAHAGGVYAVTAKADGVGGAVVDICTGGVDSGGGGHYRSTDGGDSWVYASSGLPACDFRTVHGIATSPYDANVVFAAPNGATAYESDDGGATWTPLGSPSANSRPAWIVVHPASDGAAGHFDVYVGNGAATSRQTCTGTCGWGLRCSADAASWEQVAVDHGDQNGMVYGTEPGDHCPRYLVSDGGVHGSPDCGGHWLTLGSSSTGFQALQLYNVAGQVHPDATDLFLGTQDNDLWASADGGATWPASLSGEGIILDLIHSSTSALDQTVTLLLGWPFDTYSTGALLASLARWNHAPDAPPDELDYHPVWIDRSDFVEFGRPGPTALSQLYLSTDRAGSWAAIPGAAIDEVLRGFPALAGPDASPTLYVPVARPGAGIGLARITGLRSGSAVVEDAGTGLGSIAWFCPAWGTWVCPVVFAVDPNDASHLIAADSVAKKMMVSRTGGASWGPDDKLTALVTDAGRVPFIYGGPDGGSQVRTIAFDPTDGRRIFVGTDHLGIVASFNGGDDWRVVPGTAAITASSAIFIDERENVLLASTFGRGLWRVPLGTDLALTKTAAPKRVSAGMEITYTLTVSNLGIASASDVTVEDPLPEHMTFVRAAASDGGACTAPAPGSATGTVTCAWPGPMAATTARGASIVVRVTPGTATGTVVTNRASVSSATFDQNAANDAAAADTTVIVHPECFGLLLDLSLRCRSGPRDRTAGTTCRLLELAALRRFCPFPRSEVGPKAEHGGG